jgi:hypothetical protein
MNARNRNGAWWVRYRDAEGGWREVKTLCTDKASALRVGAELVRQAQVDRDALAKAEGRES